MSGVEIERKFLVRKGDAYKRVAFSCTHIQQGYIPAEGATVRVRVRDDHAYLTIKSRSQDGGLSRYEFEKEITCVWAGVESSTRTVISCAAPMAATCGKWTSFSATMPVLSWQR